ncbi:hypothetical protein PIB30_068731 [Stylosanthes scabra]|uniref:Uncharacterized protein n=1 Tax=Stylosanthes scabra TaxID=79078 RepID=A0ABU6ZLR1_9FABA|nr:hypothetical protein [Stylosanthes scabra]
MRSGGSGSAAFIAMPTPPSPPPPPPPARSPSPPPQPDRATSPSQHDDDPDYVLRHSICLYYLGRRFGMADAGLLVPTALHEVGISAGEVRSGDIKTWLSSSLAPAATSSSSTGPNPNLWYWRTLIATF